MARAVRRRGVELRFTTRADGDASELTQRSVVGQITEAPCTFLVQEHGPQIVHVDHPLAHDGAVADAALVTTTCVAAAVRTADCAPIAIVGDRAFAVVHAGWRGLVSGVVESAIDAVATHDPGPIDAVLGPCIHAECYEFGERDLGVVAARYGDTVRGMTAGGRPALDLVAAVRAAFERRGIVVDTSASECTACSADHFSHRARSDTGRQLLVAWRPTPVGPAGEGSP